MAIINWKKGVQVTAYCSYEEFDAWMSAHSAFREKRGVRRRISGGDHGAYVTDHGFKRSFIYQFDEAAVGIKPAAVTRVDTRNAGFSGQGGISSWGLDRAMNGEAIIDMETEYSRLFAARMPWKRISEKKFLTLFRGWGYEPYNYEWIVR